MSTQPAPTPETDGKCLIWNTEVTLSIRNDGSINGRVVEADFARELERQRNEATAQLAELQATFDLQRKADIRAIKMWQKANPGNNLTWPDSAKLSVWLLTKIKEAEADAERLASALKHMVNCFQHPDQLADEALAAHEARVK